MTDPEVFQKILHRYVAINRRDAVHLAVMERQGISAVLTFDRGFDGYPGIRRLS